ncbi:hypothetical protein FMM05_00690 [Flavobacterium zepuense]|uniref:DUF2938 domain-containing protein n=1 Tax=Flavobacterium zepuense TaxID=2593302 RepID=A0A552V9V0_9FLAO|nr:hypothetical protein [Flavobacterium zepuense]TRW27190.1 hypothetical protein FMM05_00690 [Flavobacterium zepuense]
MKTINKIIIAGAVGTTFMTLYSMLRSKQDNQEYSEPVLINELIDNSKNLPAIKNEITHPAGYILHYVTGVGFVSLYWLLWKKVLLRPSGFRIVIVGGLSGLTGIAVWKILFKQHNSHPYNNRFGYYKQLLTAHIIFSATALVTYKALGTSKRYYLS